MDDQQKLVFQFFTEVGIIHQLSVAMFNKRLPDGLHVSHFSVLNHLVRLGDGKMPQTLARAFQLSKGTMTHTLAELSKRGFIQLVPNEKDGRSKLVFVTDSGRVFRKKAMENLGPLMSQLETKLDFEKIAKMQSELAAIRAVLDDNRDI